MTTWRNESETDERVFCQVLRRDDGKQLGFVVRYSEDGPTYTWTMVRCIGACSTDQGGARRGRARPRGGEVGSRGGPGLPGVGPLLAVTPLGWGRADVRLDGGEAHRRVLELTPSR
jgi:hypothetical protein